MINHLISFSIAVNSFAADFEVIFNVKVDRNKIRLESDDKFVVHDKKKTYARCEHKNNTVYIRKSWWDNNPYWYKKKVMFHELGHCVLKLSHPQGDEKSIMDIRLDTVKKNGSNWDILIKEMKGRYADKKKNVDN